MKKEAIPLFLEYTKKIYKTLNNLFTNILNKLKIYTKINQDGIINLERKDEK